MPESQLESTEHGRPQRGCRWHAATATATATRPILHVALQNAGPDGTTATWGEYVTVEEYEA